MKLSDAHKARLERTMKWFAPARFGMFYHYGLYTGGGCSVAIEDDIYESRMKYETAEEFEAATPGPEAVAANMAQAAKDIGAKYAILTAVHTGDAITVLFPTKNPTFYHKTKGDYVGEFIKACNAREIKPFLYLPMGFGGWEQAPYGPCIDPKVGEQGFPAYYTLLCELIKEIYDRYGKALAGLWLDGRPEFGMERIPAYIRSLWGDDIIITNNAAAELDVPETDFGTSEEHEDPCSPAYNRWSGYRRNGRWGATPPRRDFNEDIPTPNYWWYNGPGRFKPEYLNDRFFLLREFCCAMGQRGIWNFAPGIGPMIDGAMPPEILPSLKAIQDFLEWGSEAIYNTKGAEATIMTPGYFDHHNSIGFCSITTPYADPNTFYVLVTQTPLKGFALFETAGYVPKRITDLRTGEELSFEMWSGPYLEGVDWSDVDTYGVKVLKFEF